MLGLLAPDAPEAGCSPPRVPHLGAGLADDLARRAHQRLLREFLSQHLAEGRSLRAYEVWERNSWGAVEAGT